MISCFRAHSPTQFVLRENRFFTFLRSSLCIVFKENNLQVLDQVIFIFTLVTSQKGVGTG